MDSSDRSHRTGTTTTSTTSELFICFTSRLSSSSSSMKMSSKSSILSPGRARDPPVSLSTSLSRRLRASGSIKNGQASPMFPTGGRKKGGGFENPEPSSPKVTCIGQVRVKTKKQGQKMRTLSRRRSGSISFRKTEHPYHDPIQRQSSVNSNYQQQDCSSHRNQRWVHLPLTICETLRAIGSEFSCLFPCRSSCFSTGEREKEEKIGRDGDDGGRSSCGAVFARWLVAVQEDGEGGKGRDIELMVGGADEEEVRPIRSSRRHVFDEIDIKDDIFEVNDHEEGRVSICIPPKNALLLMRCRSDPVKMEALAHRFWEPQLPNDDENEEDGEERKNEADDYGNKEEPEKVDVKDEVAMVQKDKLKVFEEKRVSFSVDINEEKNNPEAEKRVSFSVDINVEMEMQENEEENSQINEEVQEGEQAETEESRTAIEEDNELSFVTALEALVDQESEEVDKTDPVEEKNEEERRVSYSYTSFSLHSDDENCKPEVEEEDEEELAAEAVLGLETLELAVEKETQDNNFEVEAVEKVTQDEEEGGTSKLAEERETERNSVAVERESDLELKKEERESSGLPDCLLLMMCEPKLSMEVSKETWVCSTDFIRWQPEKKIPVKVKQPDCVEEKRVSVDSKSVKPFTALPPPRPAKHQTLLQPPRSSCSLPAKTAAVSMGTMIEEKLGSAVAYEPLVLTRCKSEPMTTASKLTPDACYWKNNKLEPHRRSTVGVGAAGVGF